VMLRVMPARISKDEFFFYGVAFIVVAVNAEEASCVVNAVLFNVAFDDEFEAPSGLSFGSIIK